MEDLFWIVGIVAFYCVGAVLTAKLVWIYVYKKYGMEYTYNNEVNLSIQHRDGAQIGSVMAATIWPIAIWVVFLFFLFGTVFGDRWRKTTTWITRAPLMQPQPRESDEEVPISKSPTKVKQWRMKRSLRKTVRTLQEE